MGFFSGNAFAGGGYACARRDAALVFGEEAPVERAVEALDEALSACDAVVVGAGAGLSTAAGMSYSGKRFDDHFSDFRDAFGITDMYSGGFYPFSDLRTYWAWWSRHILVNRYDVEPGAPYLALRRLLEGREWFVVTTNVDHQFQLAGFDEDRLFCTQGDYGLFQCARNCSGKTYGNEDQVRAMAARQTGLRVPADLVPRCPDCEAPLVPNLRINGSFCEDEAWCAAAARYDGFRRRHARGRVLYLELGVGANTPVIIKYPFWEAVGRNEDAVYACLNWGEACAPQAIASRSILIDTDIDAVLR